MKRIDLLEAKLNEVINELKQRGEQSLEELRHSADHVHYIATMLLYDHVSGKDARALKIAECLVERHFEDPLEEARHILRRLEGE